MIEPSRTGLCWLCDTDEVTDTRGGPCSMGRTSRDSSTEAKVSAITGYAGWAAGIGAMGGSLQTGEEVG